ncbi:Hypothetical protein FKW44_019786, partial [Caligus rogercresseyi]
VSLKPQYTIVGIGVTTRCISGWNSIRHWRGRWGLKPWYALTVIGIRPWLAIVLSNET